MSGFSCHHDQSDNASFLHNYNFLHAPSSMQKDDTNIHSSYSPVWPRTNECFQDLPLHFQLKEATDATAGKHADEFPSSAGFCGFSESIDDRNAADLGETTQMPKRRKKINSKVASRQTDEQRMKASKMEKEQSSGTQEIGYVYVRARRGQATDSHSLAERVRREKIGERMKLLQSLVPGCAKIAGKAQLLDEIINYVHSLQTQVQILVGKLSILSPYVSGYNESNQGNATESICRLEASLSSMMMESSCNLLHSADDSQHNSLVSASSSSLTSQGDQKHFISQGVEVPMWEIDVQEHIGALDQCWLDHWAQQE